MWVLTLTTATLYSVCGSLFLLRLLGKSTGLLTNKNLLLAMAFTASGIHLWLLYQVMNTPFGMDISFFSILSLMSWLVVLLLVLAIFKYEVDNLSIFIMPLAAVFVLLRQLTDQHHYLNHQLPIGLEAHILLSILAYSLLSIAAVQAILLYIQDNHLRNRHPGGFIRALPPLQSMEAILFHIIGLGFFILSLALMTGAFYLDNIMQQQGLLHKTILSVIGWVVFAILLWGRYKFGWRGRVAIRWTISGFLLLMLAYFGSKFVLELILHR